MENPNVCVCNLTKTKESAVMRVRFTKGALIFITVSSLAYLVGLTLLVMELFDCSLRGCE